MDIAEINSSAKKLFNAYLNDEIEKELQEYARFFTKKDVIQPETSGTFEDLMRLCSLAVDLQAVRERVVLLYLDIKKAKSRLDRLKKELLTKTKIITSFKKQSNKEMRDLFLYQKSKMVDTAYTRSKYLSEKCDLILSNIDSHVWVLKNNSQVLSRAARTND